MIDEGKENTKRLSTKVFDRRQLSQRIEMKKRKSKMAKSKTVKVNSNDCGYPKKVLSANKLFKTNKQY